MIFSVLFLLFALDFLFLHVVFFVFLFLEIRLELNRHLLLFLVILVISENFHLVIGDLFFVVIIGPLDFGVYLFLIQNHVSSSFFLLLSIRGLILEFLMWNYRKSWIFVNFAGPLDQRS